ncbi:MAG TPA: hypothetical protein VLB84_03385, partial [Bacteroidia bacterium]|nr:hypothetical protein [Bacteroidia bacterium]
MKNELIKIVICLILLTSIKAKSQLIDESIVTSYDPANNFYEFKKETVTKATDLFAAIDRRKAGGINLRLFKSSVDQKGLKHDKYFQYYNNILIEGTEFIVHNDNEQRPQSANGKLYDNLSINTVPAISETQAISNAIRYSGAKQFRWEVPSYENRLKEDSHNQSASYYPNATLVIKNCASPGKPDDFRLCFKIHIYSTIPAG